MKTEISKGAQKFIWHLVAFVAVFVIALVIICRVLPEPSRTATIDQSTQITTSQTEENLSTDFDSVKERVDQANISTGKEIKDLYSGEGKSTMQKQLETRLFFNTLKSILICILLDVAVIVLIKKGFSLKKVKKIFDEDDETPEDDTPEETPDEEDRFDRVQLKLKKHRKKKNENSDRLFSGNIRCGHCGYAPTYHPAKYPYYQCHTHVLSDVACYGNRVLEQELADIVLTAAKQMALVAIDALTEVDNKKSEVQTKASELKKKIRQLKAQEEKLLFKTISFLKHLWTK